ncbi:MAG TPA: YjbQ family protein, partial [Vicinamibacterales bacterium]|nr:YjbQ family protein [Vicinamibacterales bacterium]
METLTATAICRMATIAIATERPTQFVDLTDRLDSFVADSGIRLGLLNVQTLHTTTAVVVNEHEPLLLADFSTM